MKVERIKGTNQEYKIRFSSTEIKTLNEIKKSRQYKAFRLNNKADLVELMVRMAYMKALLQIGMKP